MLTHLAEVKGLSLAPEPTCVIHLQFPVWSDSEISPFVVYVDSNIPCRDVGFRSRGSLLVLERDQIKTVDLQTGVDTDC